MQTRCHHYGCKIPDIPERVYENPNPFNAIPSAYNDLNKFTGYIEGRDQWHRDDMVRTYSNCDQSMRRY